MRPRQLMLYCYAGPLLLVALLSSAGCSSKGPEYPEDHARYLRLDQAVESLRKAYVRKDPSALETLMLPNEAADRLLVEMRRDFEEFQDITLEFAIERVVIDGEDIDVFLHWQGHWKPPGVETGIRDRGHGVLHWKGIQSILLAGTGGDLPFGMALRRPTPAPTPTPS